MKYRVMRPQLRMLKSNKELCIKEESMKAKTFRIITFSVVGVLLAIILALNIAASMFGTVLIGILSGTDVSSATRAAGEALAEQIVQEGTVLVKNEENTLPLDPENADELKLNVFGWSSVNWVSSGSGSGRATNDGDPSLKATEIDFLKALDRAGVAYNTELTEFYKTKGERNSYAWDTLHGYDYESCRLVEPAMSDYSETLLANAENFSDVAVVVLSRVAGESTDAPLVQYKGAVVSSTPNDTVRTYLDASEEELALLSYVGEHFQKVIVLINATNQMNLNFLRDVEGLDACLVTGGTGNTAATGIVNLLYGQGMYSGEDERSVPYGEPVSPSGRLTDTYVYDFRTNSSWANTGNLGVGYYDGANGLYPLGETNGNFHGNPAFTQVSYLDYVEDIYIGYKWYETADKEGFWNSDFAKTTFGIQNGYSDVVQFPFGYGLSYTNFSWDVIERPDTSAITAANANDELKFVVSVTNNGTLPAQEVVELYFTPPYNKGGIEKAAVNLLAFAKTPVAVAPGQTQRLELAFTPSDMGSYDSHGVKIENGGWILEAGDYELSFRTDAHTVADMSNATFRMNAANDIKSYDEEQAYNLFTGNDAVDYGISVDGSNTGANITYLSRNNFEGTFPTVDNSTSRTSSTKHRTMDQKLKDTNLYDAADATQWTNEQNAGTAVTKPTLGAKNGLMIFDGKKPNDLGITLGADYDNETWEDVLDQLTFNEMRDLALHGYIHEEAISSVGKERTDSLDGPSQFASFNVSNGIGIGYPNPSVLAQTWNPELSKSFGLAVAAEAGESGRQGWYAPGVNLHRSAFGGRNYEYYSEDSLFSGIMAARTVEGSLDAGIYVYIKHIIGYDQETARDGLYCWMTEQALRETYLRPFKIILDEIKENVEGTAGLMTSYGRIGAIWSGGSQALISSLLRDEWGYRGTVLTDYADHHNFMNGDQMVRAGGDIWMDGASNNGSFNSSFGSTESNAAFVARLREGAHHVLYTICNAAYVNSNYNATADAPIINEGGADFPLWTIIGVVDGVVIAGCAVWVVLAILKKDKKKVAQTAEASEASEVPETSEMTEAKQEKDNSDETFEE